MMGIETKRIEILLEETICNLKQSASQLVVVTKEVPSIDFIRFFEQSKKLKENRFYWSNAENTFAVSGVGEQIRLSCETNEFVKLNQYWDELKNSAIVINPDNEVGTGLFAIGGMAFDSKKSKTELWEHFKENEFIIPKYFITMVNGKYYYTYTIKLNEQSQVSEIIQQTEEAEQLLFNGNSAKNTQASILSQTEIAPTEWKLSVQKAVNEIKSGRANKIVLARELRLTLNRDAELGLILSELEKNQANSYVFAIEKETDCFIGATPERLVKVEGKQLLSTCLAGTAPRGKTILEDKMIASELLNDEKNLEEHGYVVKMIDEAIQPFCTNIEMAERPTVLTLKNLQHLYTPVSAKLKSGYTIFDVALALHPTPALGGVPTEKSLAFIRENELLDRGWYGAPVGWLDANDNGEFAVAIRSGLIQENKASLFAGCGVMRDSDPDMEYEETGIKFMPMLSVLGG